MSDAPPPIIEAPPVIDMSEEVAEPRNYWGWVCLSLIFVLMLANSLVGSFTKPAPKTEVEEEGSYSSILSLEVSMRRLTASAPQGSIEEQKKSIRKISEMLREPISNLAPKALKDVESARLYAAMRTERGDPVPAEQLATLRGSKDPKDRALAEIYGSAILTRPRAQDLGRELPNKPFVYRLAKVHALEKAGEKNVRDREFTGRAAIAISAGTGLVMLIVAGGIIFWGAFRSMMRQGKIQNVGLPLGNISLADADRLAIRAAQIFAAFLVLQLLSASVLKGGAAVIVAGVGIIVAVVILAMVPVNGKRILLQAVGVSTKNFGVNIMWGIGGFFVELPVTMMLMFLGSSLLRFLPTPTHPVSEQLLNSKDIASALPLVFFGSITAPLWEEFVFRGLIFPALARVIGRLIPAAVATGFAFAMIHPQGIAAWLALATVGFFGCGLTYYSRSLVPTIVMHMLHNTTMFLLVLIVIGIGQP